MDEFDHFVRNAEPRLRRALTAARGPQLGRDATAEALAYAWEHWDRVRIMANPVGYLYRVGQSRTRPRRTRPDVLAPVSTSPPDYEPRLPEALRALPEQQRVAVLLTQGFEWTHAEVAELLDVTTSTVSTHDSARAWAPLTVRAYEGAPSATGVVVRAGIRTGEELRLTLEVAPEAPNQVVGLAYRTAPPCVLG